MQTALSTAGSRRERRKERTRREIYEAAMALFAAHGIDGVTLDAICESAGVARATFFLHFPSKASLLFEYAAGLAELAAERVAAGPDAAAPQFREVAQLLCERWLEHEAVLREMLRELLADPRALRGAAAGRRSLVGVVAGIVERGQARGELRPRVSPDVAATAFLSSSLAFLGADRRSGRRSPASVRNQLVDLVLFGLTAPEAVASR